MFAADVSRSIDQPKFQLQREGYAAAIADKRVLEAITGGRHRRIAVAFVEWSGVSSQKVLIDWTVIDGPDAAKKFGDQLVELPRSFAERTSISRRHRFRHGRFEERALRGAAAHHRRVGRRHQQFRARRHPRPRRGRRQGVTINGLVILSDRPMAWNPEHTNPPGGLANYYRNNVIGGPGAFVIVAEDFNSFGQAIVKKLIAEIAELPPATGIASQPRRLSARCSNRQKHSPKGDFNDVSYCRVRCGRCRACALGAPAHAAEIKVLSTNALKSVLHDLAPKFEKAPRTSSRSPGAPPRS